MRGRRIGERLGKTIKVNSGVMYANYHKVEAWHSPIVGKLVVECPVCRGVWRTWVNGWKGRKASGSEYIKLKLKTDQMIWPADVGQGEKSGGVWDGVMSEGRRAPEVVGEDKGAETGDAGAPEKKRGRRKREEAEDESVE